MNNIIKFDNIQEQEKVKKQQMAIALDNLEKIGCISDEYITYALKFMSYQQLKYVLSIVKNILMMDNNQYIK